MVNGPREIRQEQKHPFIAPSLSLFKAILKRAADMGLVTWSARFLARCNLRGFNTLDAVNALRRGIIITPPIYDLGRDAWRIHVADSVDGRTFIVDVGLGCSDDYVESPRVEIVTAFFRRSQRKEVDDWREDHDQEGA